MYVSAGGVIRRSSRNSPKASVWKPCSKVFTVVLKNTRIGSNGTRTTFPSRPRSILQQRRRGSLMNIYNRRSLGSRNRASKQKEN